MKIYINILLVIFIIINSSCEKILFEKDLESTDPMTNFEYLWKQCDEKYSYFNVKNIDWNILKVKYSAKIYPTMSDDSLFNVLGALLNELKDDHTNLKSDFNVSSYGVYKKGKDIFDWRIIIDNYLPKNYYISGPFKHGLISNGEIGYVRFDKFTGTVDNNNLDFIMNKYKNITKGLIFDFRENGGGFVSDIFKILSRFVATKTLIYYSRFKSGTGHNDFTKAEAGYVYPNGIKYINKKVVFLVDRGTYSAGSFISLATKAIDNIVLVGDTTGGGLGIPNGGQLPNGWLYRFSISQALTLDKNPDYEKGVPPDVLATFDWNDRTKDEVIETAIQELLK